MNKKTFNIYSLVDPDNLLVHYVGCTKLDLKIRRSVHISTAKRSDNSLPLYKWINRLLAKKKKPNIVLLEKTSHHYRESTWINFFLGIAHPVKNMALLYKGSSPYDNQGNCDHMLKEFFLCNRKIKTKRFSNQIKREV